SISTSRPPTTSSDITAWRSVSVTTYAIWPRRRGEARVLRRLRRTRSADNDRLPKTVHTDGGGCADSSDGATRCRRVLGKHCGNGVSAWPGGSGQKRIPKTEFQNRNRQRR